MFVLSAQFDRVTGTRVATALTAKERELWHREDPRARLTPQQRMADALAELICELSGNKSQGTNLLVIADYDAVNKELVNARLADGSAIPVGELRSLARTANILPSIFDAKTQQMWLGRRRRTASEAQRVALTARDKGCIGCKANPLWCRAHHITWWSNGGTTDLDNLLLVCDSCHTKIHEHGWQVHRDPKTHRYQLKPPNSPNGRSSTKRPGSQNGRGRAGRGKPRPVPYSSQGAITIQLPRLVNRQRKRSPRQRNPEDFRQHMFSVHRPSARPCIRPCAEYDTTTDPTSGHDGCRAARAPPEPRSSPASTRHLDSQVSGDSEASGPPPGFRPRSGRQHRSRS